MMNRKWIRALICILMVCCLTFNMMTVPARAIVVADDLALVAIAVAILIAAGVILHPNNVQQICSIGSNFSMYMTEWSVNNDKKTEYDSWIESIEFDFSGLDGDDDGPRKTQITLAQGLLAGITAWIASVCAAGVEVQPDVSDYTPYSALGLPDLPELFPVTYPYAFVVNIGDSDIAYLYLASNVKYRALGSDTTQQDVYLSFNHYVQYKHYEGGWSLINDSSNGNTTSSFSVSRVTPLWLSHTVYASPESDEVLYMGADLAEPYVIEPHGLYGDVAPGLADGSKTEDDIVLPDTLELGNIITSNDTAYDDLLHCLDQIATENYAWKDALQDVTAEDTATDTPSLDGTTVGDADAGSFLDRLGDMIKQPIEWLGSHLLSGLKDLFVPTQAQMEGIKDQWDQLLQDRFGAAYEAVGLIDEWAAVFQDQEAITTLEFPRVTIPLLGSDQFVFGGWMVKVVPDGFDFLITALKRIISIICTLWFISGMRSRFEGALGGHLSMIVTALMDLVYALFELFTRPIQIDAMPDGVREILTSTFEYIRFGLGLLANWTDLGYLLILFGIVLAVDGGMLIYKFVMWVLRKIPMLGIE